MRLGTIAVRDALGGDVPSVTDQEIQEALWHYYYDVEKSVNYLLQSRTTKKDVNKKKAKGGSIFLRLGAETTSLVGRVSAGAGAGVRKSHGFGGASPLTHRGPFERCELT